jgi:hypothetical protein
MTRLALCLGLLAVLALSGTAMAGPSWSSFEEATFSGITLSEGSSTAPYDFILSLGSAPTITVDGATYDVSWVQGFYLLGKDSTTTFNATDAGTSDWNWSTKPPGDTGPYSVAGWEASGAGDRMYVDTSKTFSLSSFDGMDDTVYGLHLGYGNSEFFVTKKFKGDLPVPEPSSVLVIATGLGGLATFVRRRRKQV